MEKSTSAHDLFEYLKITGASLDREDWMNFNVLGKVKVKLTIGQAETIEAKFSGFAYDVKFEELIVEQEK